MFSIAQFARERTDLRHVRVLLAGTVEECADLQAENKRLREQLGLERLATALEVHKHKETLEHLRLMSLDCRLEVECTLWRKFWEVSTPDLPGITDGDA